MFKSGQQIGNYVLVQRIGRGGFGEVWLAERRAKFVTTKVAVKLPLDEQIDIETIKQEAALWEKASGHPNVLPIIDADEYDGQIVIVSEYAPDGSLEQLLKEKGALPIKQAVGMVIGILSGLQFLHQRQIIHRDIKPANILLQGETPRLADFGISRAMMTTSMSINVAGTPNYMSPEAFDGKRNVQTDIWSVGVILYQLVSGKLPFPQNSQGELLAAIIMREPEPLLSQIPSDLQRIVTRSLAKQPADRYQTAREMQEDLSNFLTMASGAIQKGFVSPPPPMVSASIPTTNPIEELTHISAPIVPSRWPETNKSRTNYFLIIGGVLTLVFVLGLIGVGVIGFIAYKNMNFNGAGNNSKTNPNDNSGSKVTSNEKGADPPWSQGNNNSAVTVEVFLDFQCATCKIVEENTMKELRSTYHDRVRFVFRHFPLMSIHPKAYDAALASEAAGSQGKFWEMHNLLLQKQTEWVNSPDHRSQFANYAGMIGLNVPEFEKKISSETGVSRITADAKRGAALNVIGTPSVFINGKMIAFEDIKTDKLKQLIDGALQKK